MYSWCIIIIIIVNNNIIIGLSTIIIAANIILLSVVFKIIVNCSISFRFICVLRSVLYATLKLSWWLWV